MASKESCDSTRLSLRKSSSFLSAASERFTAAESDMARVEDGKKEWELESGLYRKEHFPYNGFSLEI